MCWGWGTGLLSSNSWCGSKNSCLLWQQSLSDVIVHGSSSSQHTIRYLPHASWQRWKSDDMVATALLCWLLCIGIVCRCIRIAILVWCDDDWGVITDYWLLIIPSYLCCLTAQHLTSSLLTTPQTLVHYKNYKEWQHNTLLLAHCWLNYHPAAGGGGVPTPCWPQQPADTLKSESSLIFDLITNTLLTPWHYYQDKGQRSWLFFVLKEMVYISRLLLAWGFCWWGGPPRA